MPDQTMQVMQAFDNSVKQASAEARRLESEARLQLAESHRMEGRAQAFNDVITFIKNNNLSIVTPDEDLSKKEPTVEEILNDNPPVPEKKPEPAKK